jgi:phytoene synthase
MFEGRPVRRHPIALALEQAVRRRELPRASLDALVDARLRDLEPWPLDPAQVEPYLDATAGALMALTAHVLEPGVDPHVVRSAARAYGLAGLQQLGRLPADWSAEKTRGRIEAALSQTRTDLAKLPAAAFPAVAYAEFARPLAGRAQSELGKRLRLTWAVLRGTL